jgi:alpha-galactosidase
VTARKDGDNHLRFEVPVGGRQGPEGASIIMGTFAGDGWAAIRHYLGSISRDVGPPPVVANTWQPHAEDIDEATVLADIPVAARAGVEVYTIDAGWYSKPGAHFSSEDGDTAREVAHVQGVYRVMEEIRRRHPEVWLEMCAAGGNRIDSEMIRRADSYWISDQTTMTDGQRLQSASAAMVLPSRYRYTAMAQSAAEDALPKAGHEFSEEPWLTALSGTFGIMQPFASWSTSVRKQAAREVMRFKEIRHLLDGDVTILRDDATRPNRGWEAWEFSDAASGEAALFAFRQDSSDQHRSFDAQNHWDVDLPKREGTLLQKR